ncbi:hypothetical protein K488DRAFT_57250 [Vararia minispora EC-137]|uniref:Uncharacterized protein n=1 Tax=Vararia minispora EC-137 TaxID=1314806 RepID=A0ACB8QB75_9AGAM|nr:hypothetical protein K488DRAFT_57250 [Vararia minispora EC-137]
MLVVDVMHEFELGVWKALLLQLIRILHALGPSTVQEFNERFRQISTFGASTIRRFGHNVSELKKLAARDFEDILQCCIPCFEGLLPDPHDASVLDLLYLSVYWHSLAKLRMQTGTSLCVLDHVTVHLAKALRYFSDVTCAAFDTVETDGEYQARCRAENRRHARSGGTSQAQGTGNGGKQKKTFNLDTYKMHSLGDYVPTIRAFGTTDSYSTQIGETEHRVVKRRYRRTNFRNIEDQFVKMDVLETIHERMYEELEEARMERTKEDTGSAASPPLAAKRTQAARKEEPYIMAMSQSKPTQVWLTEWLRTEPQKSDPGYKDFVPKLKRHILQRYCEGHSDNPDIHSIDIRADTIYQHKTTTINYTTYDIRRESDLIHVKTPMNSHCDVMMHSERNAPGEHPFRYARVHGIYHANVFLPGKAQAQRIDFLFVRWFAIDRTWKGGPLTKRLDRISYVNEESGSAFGFLDPGEIVRACHLLPVFATGKSWNFLSMKSSLQDFTDGSDWKHYYVSRFVDRDMMQRYLGWGIGHRNPPDFPHEAHDLVSSDADRVLEHGHGHGANDGEASRLGRASQGQMPEDTPDVDMAAVGREGSIDEGEYDTLGVRAGEGEAGEDEDEDEDDDEDADAPNGGLDEGAWEDSLGVFDF